MHPPKHPHRLRCAALTQRLTLGLCGLLTAALLTLSPPAARAQTSTLVYGSDTSYVESLQPSLLTGGSAHYNTVESLLLGQGSGSSGSAYDPNPVDVSQGFVFRVGAEINASDGLYFAIQQPGVTDITSTSTNSLIVDVVSSQQSSPPHISEVLIYTQGPNQSATIADITGLNITSTFAALNNVFQVRYVPKFGTLDVYIGSHLITRVANVDLTQLGIAPGGKASLGVASFVPFVQGGYTVNPTYLDHFSISNQLTFGTGFGPNYYEDRFPFLTTGQSIWGNSSNSIEHKSFLGTDSGSNGTVTKTSSSIGTSYALGGSPVFSLSASAFASYDLGIDIDATATGGTANISYPLFLDMEFPAQYSVAAGNTFALPMAFYPDLSAAITTTSPTANVTADILCQTTFGVNLDASIFGKSIASGQLFSDSINVRNTKFFDAQTVLTSGLIPGVNGGQAYLQGDEGEQGTRNATEDGTRGTGSSEGAKKGASLTKYVNVNITVPDLSTSGTVTGTTGKHLTSSAASPFVTLSSDFTNAVLSEIPGLDILTAIPFFNNDYSLNLGGSSVELGSHFSDIYGDINVGTAVSFDFTPQPQVYLTLSPADPANPDGLGPYPLDPATGKLLVVNDPATGKMLSPPTLTMPANGSPLTVTPRVVINTSQLQTTGQFTLGGDLSINPLSLSYFYNGSGFSTDPAFGFPLTVGGSIPVYTYLATPFAVGNLSGGLANAVPFQTSLQGKSFILFPTAANNPLIDAVSPNMSLVQPAGSTATLPIQITAERASVNGDVVWDYDGVPADPQTTLPSRVWNSDTSLSAAIPYSLLTAQGLHTITLINHNNGDSQLFPSNLSTFTVNAPVPVLSQISTATGGTTVSSGFTLTVSGSSFSPRVAPVNGSTGYPGSVVLWNGQPLATTVTDQGHLSAAVPSSLITTVSTPSIAVFTAGPGGGTSSALSLSVVNPAPALSSLSQTQIAPGLTSLTLTLTGTGFVPSSTVLLTSSAGSATQTVTYLTPTTLNLALGAADLSTAGTFTVKVQTPAPGGGTTLPLTYTVGQAPVSAAGVFLVPAITQTSAGYVVGLTVRNTSLTASAASTIITAETIGGDGSGKNAVYPILPNPLKAIVVGTIPVGGSFTTNAQQSDTFPLSIGTPGQAVVLTIQGSSAGRTFTSRLRVTLPNPTVPTQPSY